MAGLLDFLGTDDARLGLSLLAAAGPSAQPMGFGQRLQQGMAGFDDYKRDALKAKLADMQYQTGLLGLTQAQQAAQDDASARSVLRGAYGSGMPAAPAGGPQLGMGSTGGVNASLPPEQQMGAMPALPGAGGSQQPTPKVDVWSRYKAIGDQMAAQGLVKQAQTYYDLAEKFRPKYNTTPQQMMVGGKLVNVLVGEDGTTKTLDGFEVKPDMVESDLGGRKVWLNKNAVAPGQSFDKTMTPGEVASNSLGWANNKATLRGQDMTDQRSREQTAQGRVPTGYRQTADGSLEFIPGGPADPNAAKRAAPTEFQGKSTTFAARMQDAAKVLDSLEGTVSPMAVARAGYQPSVPAWLGGSAVGAPLAAGARMTTNADEQKYAQAQENWVTANLRQESGAAIGKEEMEKDIRKWFPQAGDSTEVKEQKAAARKVAERAMLVQAGPGAASIPGIVGDAPASPTPGASSGVHWRYENGKLVKVK